MGDLDLLKPVLEHGCGAEIVFGRVDVKPGKPVTVAVVHKDKEAVTGMKKMVFALPGNPVSALVTFHLFALPSLRLLSSHPSPNHQTIPVRLLHAVPTDPRPEYMRARLTLTRSFADSALVEWTATTTGMQRSSRVASMAGANGLIRVPARKEREAEGKNVDEVEEGEVLEAVILERGGW
ncbi:hypothetical protein HDU93_002669 [Gonapodya sp. JEL0774]|nr:hypothetical protein HDU93_002669 [Gonapodya sp. JEL0774]